MFYRLAAVSVFERRASLRGTRAATLIFVFLTCALLANAQLPFFFTGEALQSDGTYYLQLPDGPPFGSYTFTDSSGNYIWHVDLGYELVYPSTTSDLTCMTTPANTRGTRVRRCFQTYTILLLARAEKPSSVDEFHVMLIKPAGGTTATEVSPREKRDGDVRAHGGQRRT
jgi:hypothetical protein